MLSFQIAQFRGARFSVMPYSFQKRSDRSRRVQAVYQGTALAVPEATETKGALAPGQTSELGYETAQRLKPRWPNTIGTAEAVPCYKASSLCAGLVTRLLSEQFPLSENYMALGFSLFHVCAHAGRPGGSTQRGEMRASLIHGKDVRKVNGCHR